MFVRLGVCIVPFRVALCVRRGTDSRWRNVVPPTLPASCGIESARFRVLRVGGMPGRLLVRLLAVCLLLFHFAFVSKTGLPLQQSLS